MSKTFTTALRNAFGLKLQESGNGDADAILAMLDSAIDTVASTKPTKTLKRARTAYQLWKGDEAVKEAYRESHPGETGAVALNKGMGALWKSLDDDARATWVEAAVQEKQAFVVQAELSGDEQKTKTTTKPLTAKTVRARTAYMFFKMDEATKQRVISEMAEASFGDKSKAVATWWKALTEEELAPYTALAEQDKERVQSMKAMETPAETVKTVKTVKAVKADKVKRARSAFLFYKMDAATKEAVASAMSGASFGDKSKAVAAWWKALSPEELAPYTALAEQDKLRQQEETAAATPPTSPLSPPMATPPTSPAPTELTRSKSCGLDSDTETLPKPHFVRSNTTTTAQDAMAAPVVVVKQSTKRGPSPYQLFKSHQTEHARQTSQHFPKVPVAKMTAAECRIAWNELGDDGQASWIEQAAQHA